MLMGLSNLVVGIMTRWCPFIVECLQAIRQIPIRSIEISTKFFSPAAAEPNRLGRELSVKLFFPLTFFDRKRDSSFFDDVIKKYVTSSTVGRSQELFVTCPIIGFQSEHYLIFRLDSIVELKRQGEYFSHWQHELKCACHCLDKLTVHFLSLVK